jgi:hypothetical protein
VEATCNANCIGMARGPGVAWGIVPLENEYIIIIIIITAISIS